MKNKLSDEIVTALLGGGICGAIALLGLLFVTPERWYLAFVIAAVMGGIVYYKTGSEKKKNSGRYERDEHLIDFPWVYSVEGFLRGSSDRSAKFYFGEDKIGVLFYNNVRPLTKEYGKERIKAGYTDRCGWFSIVIEGEKERIVIPKEKAEKAASVLEEILQND